MRVYDDHCTLDDMGLCHERVNQLRAREYAPAVSAMHVVPSSSDNHVYPVWKVEPLPAPLDGEEDVDPIDDRITVWVCGCDQWWYRCSAADGEMAEPTEWDDCKHIRAVARERRAEHDDSQQTL